VGKRSRASLSLLTLSGATAADLFQAMHRRLQKKKSSEAKKSKKASSCFEYTIYWVVLA